MNTKALREEWNFTQEGLSRLTGIPRDRIAKWEQGKGGPKANDAEILNIVEKRLYEIKDYEIESQYYKEVFESLKYGLKVRNLRIKNNLSLAELAYNVDLNEENLWNIEQGYFKLNDPALNKLWEYFGIKLPDYVNYEGEKVKTNTSNQVKKNHTLNAKKVELKISIKQFREKWGLSQDDVSKLTGIPKDRLANLELLNKDPNKYDAQALELIVFHLDRLEHSLLDAKDDYEVLPNIKYGIRLLQAMEMDNINSEELSNKTGVEAMWIDLALRGLFDKTEPILEPIWKYFNIGLDLKENLPSFKDLLEYRLNIADNKIPFISFDNITNYIQSENSYEFSKKLSKYSLPPGVLSLGTIWQYFEFFGDNMEPTLSNFDILLCSQVAQEDWKDINDWYIYIIITNDRIRASRLKTLQKEHLLLISDNTKYDAFTINLSEVKEIWMCRRIIKDEGRISRTEIKAFKARVDQIISNLDLNTPESHETAPN